MAFCSKCGQKLIAKAKFCSSCGEEVNKKDYVEKATKTVEKILDTEDTTKKFTKKDIEENRVMAIIAYILAPVPFFADKKSKYVHYHAIQGMNLFLIEVGFAIISSILVQLIQVTTLCVVGGTQAAYYCKSTPWWVNLPLTLVGFGIGALAVIGIVNVVQGKAKELPLIGNLKIFK